MPAGGNSRFRGYPARMSERQQLALILQMTSQEMTSGSSSRTENSIPSNTTRSSPLQHQKHSKRWSNKNADLIDVNTSYNRQDDQIVNGCDTKERSEFAGSSSPDEARQASRAESPLAAGSPAESATCNAIAPNLSTSNAVKDQPQLHHHFYPEDKLHQHQKLCQDNNFIRSDDNIEMRRTPPQNRVTGDRQVSNQQQQQAGLSQGSNINAGGRVTLRLNQVRTTRDDKKSVSGTNPTQSNITTTSVTTSTQQLRIGNLGTITSASTVSSGSALTLNSSQMDSSSNSSSKSTSAIAGTPSGNTSSSSSGDCVDVYEFKSSKEATPVRGSSTSPKPNPMDKDSKDSSNIVNIGSSQITAGVGSMGPGQGQNVNIGGSSNNIAGNAGSSNAQGSLSSSTATSSATTTTSSNSSSSTNNQDCLPSSAAAGSAIAGDDTMLTTASPGSAGSSVSSGKRHFENETQGDEDEEGRKRKKKDDSSGKDLAGNKSLPGRGQSAGRNNAGVSDKNIKAGKQTSSTPSTKSNQSSSSNINVDHKSPSSLSANSPKPSSTSSANTSSQKNNPTSVTSSTLGSSTIESDGEDDRSKSSDSGSGPKVPPLKIVIPQSTTSEQEQGNRNGKNASNRSHQLPYVVASSNNSNDSMDKEQTGAGSPMENSGAGSKNEEKKDFAGAIDEARSTHHQRVLRSSHRSGNGNGNSQGNGGSYSNSSPLSVNAADRSNTSSPQRHNSPTPDASTESTAAGNKSVTTDSPGTPAKGSTTNSGSDKSEKTVDIKKEPSEAIEIKKENTAETPGTTSQSTVELHPRKRKIKSNKEAQQQAASAAAAATENIEVVNSGPEVHPHDQPITNCQQLYLNIRNQIQRRRKGLFAVQPKPPQGFKDYLMNRCTYVLASNAKEPTITPPANLPPAMKDLYIEQEKNRHDLRMQHVVEKEKLVLSVEQEILRVHGRAARALANQSLPFSVCTILKDEEVYNVITPEQEEKDRNARSRYNGRLFLSWLQDVDDKWEKIKEAMLLRHHNEAESLHAVQRMDWEWKLQEVGLCDCKSKPNIDDLHVPMVHVSDDFDLLPA